MKAKCKRCGDTVEVTRTREYKSCKCGAIGLDYGDGYYFRVCGNPEDFDGEIEDSPKIHDGEIKIEHYQPGKTITTCHSDTSGYDPNEEDWDAFQAHRQLYEAYKKQKEWQNNITGGEPISSTEWVRRYRKLKKGGKL